MIALITRYILFIQLIFNSFTTFSISVKTYQVRRINESTYLVTSFPEFDNENHKRFLTESSTSINNVVTLNDDKRYTEDYDTTMSTVTVGEKRDKARQKIITPELIKKARENYFRSYFATMRRTNFTSLLPDKVNPYINLAESSNENTVLTVKFKQNLLTARKLASLLINEAQYQTELRNKDTFLDDVKRRKRKLNKKGRRKSYWAGVGRRHMDMIQSKNLSVPESKWVT